MELKDVATLVIAATMPFVLFILNDIKKSIGSVREAFADHVKDDANRLTRLETLAGIEHE